MARTVSPHIRGAGDESADIHGLAIVAVGSMWKSWDLLRDSFLAAATARHPTAGTSLRSFKLLRLTTTSAVGAAWKAAEVAGVALPVDFAANVSVLYEHSA